jgi:hypothetical protein
VLVRASLGMRKDPIDEAPVALADIGQARANAKGQFAA